MRDGDMAGIVVSDNFVSDVGRRLSLERESMAVLWWVGSGQEQPFVERVEQRRTITEYFAANGLGITPVHRPSRVT